MSGPNTGTWPGFVARVATPATPEEIALDLCETYPSAVGGEIPGGVLVATLAQILLETGTRAGLDAEHQAAGYWNGNAGNVRGSYLGAWTSFSAGEGHGASAVVLEPGPSNRFASYVLPDEDPLDPGVLRVARRRGVHAYLDLLARRYGPALEAAERRDYAGYVHALHAGGYFTASETAYGSAEERLRHTIENLPLVAAYLK